MCFFSLHNECPPVNYATAEVMKVTRGLVAGEEATSATLRAMADCMTAMAYMVDTGGRSVAAFGELVDGQGAPNPAQLMAKAAELKQSYDHIFDALVGTGERITFAVRKYRELQEYARDALAEGRGEDFERVLSILGGGFDTRVQGRIEMLRRLKMRVQLLEQLQTTGENLIANNKFAEFFMWFMQPFRDVSIAVNDLYNEALRGALDSQAAVLQTSRMVGEELPEDTMDQFMQSPGAFRPAETVSVQN